MLVNATETHLATTLQNQLGPVVLGRLAVGAHLRLQLALGEAVKREGVGGNRVGNKLRIQRLAVALRDSRVSKSDGAHFGVDLPGGVVQVAQVVTQLVVARVKPLAGASAKHLGLLLGLDSLGAGSNTTGGDASADEAVVVAAAVKGN